MADLPDPFTTRPEIRGTFGVVATTHWIASAVAMSMLERGGNAFDAAVAAGFVIQIVEPHLSGPAGEVPILFHDAGSGRVRVLCGQGVAPAKATPEAFAGLGLDAIPGSGLIAAVVPGAFDAWMLLLRDYGILPLADVLAPAIGYAAQGHPLLPAVARALGDVAEVLKGEWRSGAAIWLPGGEVPRPHALFRNEVLAATYQRILGEAQAGGGSRETQIDRARRVWSQGFVAEAIDRFCRAEPMMDSSGERHLGFLSGDDMARWAATYEQPVTYDYHGWTLAKTAPWGQGPAMLQALGLLKGFDIGACAPDDPLFVHLVLEAVKLAYADREAYYGDPAFADVPLGQLLGEPYASSRRSLIGVDASREFRPGMLPGFEDQQRFAIESLRTRQSGGAPGVGEPTMAHLRPGPGARPGDTTHLDVIDRWGNMVSATASGGWPQSSPTIPDLGFALNTRLQMFSLDRRSPGVLAPGKRPRTTLTPTLAFHEGRPTLVCGTPGGDQQDQWQLVLLLRRIHHRLGLQQAIDMPLFHSVHFPSSFYPREAMPGVAVVETGFPAGVVEDLRRRGHEIVEAPRWSVGRLTAAERGADGVLRAAATPRLMQAYAIGR
jgi:gamma-glutamyltranspeptidase/glutathione hydrolase